jgi:hypothetical protein
MVSDTPPPPPDAAGIREINLGLRDVPAGQVA